MALPGVLLVRLRAACHLGKYADRSGKVGLNVAEARWYKTNPRSLRDAAPPVKPGNSHLLKEYRDPKGLLYNTISRSLGVNDLSQLIQYSCTDHGDVKRATVTLEWPSKMEMEGFASRKIDAERFAAAAACHRLKEMGVIGPDNELPSRRSGRVRGVSQLYEVEDAYTSDVRAAAVAHESNEAPWPSAPSGGSSSSPPYSEALELFPRPKELLGRVIQVATSANSPKEWIQYRTMGGKLKRCELTIRWPEEIKVMATASNKVTAERRAAALGCMKLKELELLDQDNNALTHAKYHRKEVKEAGERDRRPVQLHIPEHLEESVRQYLTQYPVASEMQRLFEEEEQAQKKFDQEEQEAVKEEEEDLVTDAITGRQRHPLSAQQEQQLSRDLWDRWEQANPGLGVELPVDGHRERVVSAVESSRVVVIAGETGCGKTTRIPRFLLEGRVRGGEGATCNVLVTQPRRISAVSVAQRVAQEMGPVLKSSVGYQVRLESRPPEQSGGALLFLTVGVLLRKLQGNPSLQGVSHVVVDEVHERDINTDLLLALLRSALRENPELRVVLMSATGDNQRLAQYFGGCPVVKVPGFMHPVQDLYLEEVFREMSRTPRPPQRGAKPPGKEGKEEAAPDLDLVADVIEHIDRHGEPGAVLCFLPGWQDIKAVQERLGSKPRFASGSQMVVPLHSSLSVADQQSVFQRPPMGRRKIVLATNIAETSITIDDIVHVVDTGTQKEQNYDPRTKVSCLDTVWISRSNVTQRRGRAGRCQPGHAYHLFPREHLESMSHFPIPEILRTPLESLVVQAKVHSPNLKAVDFLSQVLDSPEKDAVKDAVRTLQDIGVLDKTETLTALGERVACLSCDPRLGKVLVLAAMFRCVLPILSVVACLTRDPFYNSMQNRALVSKAKEALSGSSHSDYLVLSRAVLGWRRVQQEGDREDRQYYLENNVLSGASLRFINGLISQFSENLYQAQLVSRSNECQQVASLYNQQSHQDELVKAVLLAGLYPNLIQVKKGVVTKGGRFRPNGLAYRAHSGPVLLHRSSVNRGKNQLPSRWLTFFSAVKSSDNVFIRDSSTVHPLALLLLTDGNITKTVQGERVQVSFPGRSLVRCELPADSWELLWELRNSLQTMLHRNLSRPDGARANAVQDAQLIALLVQLLNYDAKSNPPFRQTHDDGSSDSDRDTDSEVD
ncbi:putative ATP-dependent RNA helicase DHX30 [Merluccius polli]|uniref:ATP-dependent RNA helicase DHX30 n=1 Tax=Merluccius polli TaxID=89951 RepID=A0AA47N1F3_MERPO|nr:putative ATP-dependent RNA helicase DHX30 [Merluccius polli]